MGAASVTSTSSVVLGEREEPASSVTEALIYKASVKANVFFLPTSNITPMKNV